MLFLALPGLSPAVGATEIFSPQSANKPTSLQFALHRLERDSAIELRDKSGNILACGAPQNFALDARMLRIESMTKAEALPDCPADKMRGKAEIRIDDIAFLDLTTPHSEFYTYDAGWRATAWARPIKAAAPAFSDGMTERHPWQRFLRPPKAVPGVFWPELRMGGGAYALTRTRDIGITGYAALDFKIHRSLYRLGLIFDSVFALRQYNGDAQLASPDSLFILRGGIKYNLLDRERFTAALLVSGGIISYYFQDYAAGAQGLRGVLSMGALFQFHVLRNNRDYHKFSLFIQPVATAVFARNIGETGTLPLLFAAQLGVQYGF